MTEKRKAASAAPETQCKGTENSAKTQRTCTEILAGVRQELAQAGTAIDEVFKEITDESVVAQVEYLFNVGDEGFVEKNRINCVTSIGKGNKTGGGKSTLQKVLAAAYIAGGIGCIDTFGGDVVYIDAEMGDSRTKEFRTQVRQAVEHAGKPYYPQRLKTYTFNPEASADCDKRLQAVLDVMDKTRPSLLIFDPFTYLVGDDGQGDTPIQERLAALKRHAAKNGTTVIIVAHGTKASEDSNLSGRTGTLLQQDCSYLLGVEHKKESGDDYFGVTPMKSRGVPFKEFHFSFIGERGAQYPFPYLPADSSETMSYAALYSYMKRTFGDDEELKATDIDSRLAEIAGKGITWAKEVKKSAKVQGVISISRSAGKSVFYRLNSNGR